jgi:hypothetical protein
MQTWNFGIEREVKSVLLDANYLGTKGTHLYFGGAGSLNYLGSWVETAASDQITQLNFYVPNPFYGIITNPASSLATATVQQSQLLKPYPQFSGFSGNDPPTANSIYHSLQIKVEKRFSKGLQVLGTYVFSKSMDDSSVACSCTTWLGGTTSLQDPNRRYLERSVVIPGNWPPWSSPRFSGVNRRGVLDSGWHVADRARVEQGAEEQNVVLNLAVAFFVIMLLELGERCPQQVFVDGKALLFNLSHPAPQKRFSPG